MPPEPPRALKLEIDGAALVANWRALDRLSGKARAGAAVKADGYGLGVDAVVPALSAAGCRDFFIAHWSEVTRVAAHVDPAAIAVLHGPLTPADVAYAVAVGVRPVINSVKQARLWLEGGGGICDLMVDTGINRLGLPLADLGNEAVRRLCIDTLISHLASADEDVPLNALQLSRWQQARREVPHRRASLANSAGITLGSQYHGDLTRPGLSLYGGVPCAALRGAIRQVARPMAAVMQVRHVEAGDGLGYNSTFIAERSMRTGIVAIGYADGYLRSWSGKGAMRSGDRLLPVCGRISMDMTIVDLSAAPDVAEGDWVEVIYDLPQASAISGLSQYELITALGARFQR